MSVKTFLNLTAGALITLGAASSHADFVPYTDEAAFIAAVNALVASGQAVRINEGFDAAPFGAATDDVPQSTVTHQGILWSPPVSTGFITTSTGGGSVVSPLYQMYAVDSGGIRHPVPDGFTLSPADPANELFAVGGWFNGTPLAKVGFAVDGDPNLVDFGNAAVLDNNEWTFLGFVQDDPTLGFRTVDIRQTEEGGDETRIIFGDSFTIAAVPLPPALLLFLSGVLGLAGVAWRRPAPSA